MIFQRDPTLEELLREPIIQQVMKSDGVRPEDLRRLLKAVAGENSGTLDHPLPAVPVPAPLAGCCVHVC